MNNKYTVKDLKRLRLEAGFSRPQAADFLEVPLRTLENWEYGINNPAEYVINPILEKLLDKISKDNSQGKKILPVARSSIQCTNCGGREFEVDVNYCIPRAISLECKCGYITPIAFFDKRGRAYGINGNLTKELYDESFFADIEPSEAERAYHGDLK